MSRPFRIFLGLSFVLAAPAFAGGLVLTNPARMDCKVLGNPGYFACHLWYEGAMIYEGPMRGPTDAAADCVVCRSFKSSAIKQQRHIYLDRALGWGDDGFLSLTDDETPSSTCLPHYP